MSAPKDGGPAFPVSTGHHPDTMMKDPRIGMTLRDYFAAAAMTGWQACPNTNATTAAAVKYCFEVADAMLAERERGRQ